MDRRQIAPLARLALVVAGVWIPQLALAEVAWRPSIDSAKAEAAGSGKLVLLHFYTKTCQPCAKLDNNVFAQPHVGPTLEQNFVPVKVDAESAIALAGLYRIQTVPTDVILDPRGAPLASLTCPQDCEKYLGQLQTLVGHYRQSTARVGAPGQPQMNPAYAGLNIGPPALPPANGQSATPPYGQPRPNYMAGVTYPTGPAVAGQAVPPAGGAPVAAVANGGPQMVQNPYSQAPQRVAQSTGPTAAAANPLAAPMTAAPAPGRYASAATPAGYAPTQTPPAYAAAPSAAANIAAATPAPSRYQAPAGAPGIPPVAQQQPMLPPSRPGSASMVAQNANAVANNVPNNSVMQSAAASAPVATGGASVGMPLVAAPVRPQLPQGAAPLGLEGYCPVTLRTAGKWVSGDATVGMEHRGRTYLFLSETERQQFAADPDRYSPVFSGQDPVQLLEHGKAVEGSRRLGCNFGDRMYLFGSKDSLDTFAANPGKYAAGVRQAMSKIDAASGGTIRR